jgi:hypothetical protein
MTTTTNVTQKVEEIANMAGYQLGRHPQVPEMLVCNFDMGNGRSQAVYIMPIGQAPGGEEMVSFISPCQRMKKGLLGSMSKSQAVDLLKRNANLIAGCFAIQSVGDVDVLVFRSTQIVDTMEIEEFKFHLNLVGFIADEYEREHGTDVF